MQSPKSQQQRKYCSFFKKKKKKLNFQLFQSKMLSSEDKASQLQLQLQTHSYE